MLLRSHAVQELFCSRTVRILWFIWLLVVPATMLGQVTGLRNTLLVIVTLATLLWCRRSSQVKLPAVWAWVLILIWCCASLLWSGAPSVTSSKLKVDLVLPFLVYWASFAMARRVGLVHVLALGAIVGLVMLATISSFVWMASDAYASGLDLPWWLQNYPSILNPLPRWYPGVGDASTTALFCSVVLMSALGSGRIGKWGAGVGWVALLVVVGAAGNRNVVVLVPIAVLMFLWRIAPAHRPPGRRKWSRKTWAAVIGVATIVCGTAGYVLENAAQKRLDQLQIHPVQGESASLQMILRDTRPYIWRYYIRLGMAAPLIGVGFGRTVPGIVYRTEDDKTLAKVENNAYVHAHNIFLDWWLQTGVIGCVLFVALIASVVTWIRRLDRTAGVGDPNRSRGSPSEECKRSRALNAGALTLIAMMILRNLTDDFMVFGVAALFWALLGGLMGEAATEVDAASAGAEPRKHGPDGLDADQQV